MSEPIAVQPSATKSSSTNGTPIRKRRRRVAGGGAQDDCFTCRKRTVQCDRKRPYCSQCIDIGRECSGYKTTLTWGIGVASRGKLRGMSLPVMNQENTEIEPVMPNPTTRRQSSTARIRQENPADSSGRGRGRRSSRPSFTSHPVNIKPAITPINTQLASLAQPWSAQPSTGSSAISDHSFPINRSLHWLQPSHSSFIDDGSYSDSASSTGSFFDSELPLSTSYMSDLLAQEESHALPLDQSSDALSNTELSCVSQHPETIPEEVPFTFDPSDLAEDLFNEAHISSLSADSLSRPAIMVDFYNPFSKMAPRMQQLIQYYDTNVCPFLVAFDGPQNPYRMHILQMALQNRGLQNAMAALATNNMRMRKTYSGVVQDSVRLALVDTTPDAEELMYKQASVDQLNQQLATAAAAQDDSVLATLLVLCLFHVCDSGFSKFRTQLAGVQKLLSMRRPDQRSTFTDWVEMFFMWFDVMTSAVNDRELEIKGERFDMLEYSANLGALEQFSGCDGRLFKLIARLGRLNLLAQGRPVVTSSVDKRANATTNRSRDARDYEHLDGNGWGAPIHGPAQGNKWAFNTRPAPDARSEFWSEWHDIRSRLQDWQVDLSALSSISLDTGRMGSEQADMAHISESFRHAALLYTERLAHPLLPSASHQFQQHVLKALLHITALSVTSCVNKFLLWPLFITGTECIDAGHRAVIRSRCIEVQRESGFYNNLSGLEVLERVWADEDVGHNDAGEMKARRRDSEFVGSGTQRQAFRWRIAMDRVDDEYLII